MSCNCAQIGRYTLSTVGPGTVRCALGATGESPWPIVDGNTLVLGPGKFFLGVTGGELIASSNNGFQMQFVSTTGGPNMSSLAFPASHVERGPIGIAAWTALAELEEFYVQTIASPAPPSSFGLQLYILRAGDA